MLCYFLVQICETSIGIGLMFRSVFFCQIEVELSISKLWQLLYVEADRTPEWNNRCLFNEVQCIYMCTC